VKKEKNCPRLCLSLNMAWALFFPSSLTGCYILFFWTIASLFFQLKRKEAMARSLKRRGKWANDELHVHNRLLMPFSCKLLDQKRE